MQRMRAGEFFGTTLRAVSVPGFRLTEKRYQPSTSLPRHAHELAHLCFVISGTYNERLAGVEHERGPASLIFYPAGSDHAEVHTSPGRHLLVEIDASRLSETRDAGRLPDHPALVESGSAAWVVARLVRELSHRDSASRLALEGLTLELVAEAVRHDSTTGAGSPPVWLGRVVDILHASFTEPPPLRLLAAEANVHPSHLVRVFRRYEHCTIGEYVRRLRVEFASSRLSGSTDPLVMIALEAGFSDQTHFCRSFKRATGMTPSEYRSVHRRR